MISMNDTELFYQRLNNTFEEHPLITKQVLADIVDISQSHLSKILKGKDSSIPPADLVLKLANALNVNFEWLVTGKGQKEKKSDNSQERKYLIISESRLDIDYGGYAFLDTSENHCIINGILDVFGLDSDCNPNILDQIKKIRIDDNAMAPLIRCGDKIIIYSSRDFSLDNIVSGRIYVFLFNECAYCRRLYRQINGDIIIRADNKAFVEERLTQEQLDSNFEIIGEVLALESIIQNR